MADLEEGTIIKNTDPETARKIAQDFEAQGATVRIA